MEDQRGTREGNEGDLCWKHKGLAEFLKYEERLNSKCVKYMKCRNGMKGVNTLDLHDLK